MRETFEKQHHIQNALTKCTCQIHNVFFLQLTLDSDTPEVSIEGDGRWDVRRSHELNLCGSHELRLRQS